MPGRTIPVPSGQGQGGAVGGSSRRRMSGRSGEQAPWKSSLDLVWSYSRSQAFYGDNISTSPSFVERHWAGRRALADETNSIDESAAELSYDEYDDDFDEEEEDYQGGEERVSFSESTEDELAAEAEGVRPGGLVAGQPDWSGEALPANAVGNLQKRRRISANKARIAAMRARDRRLRSLEDDTEDGEDADRLRAGEEGGEGEEERRGRSRSRSPRRLAASRSRESRGSFGSGSRDGLAARLPRSSLPPLPAAKSGLAQQKADLRLQNGMPTLEDEAQARHPTSRGSAATEHTPLLKTRTSSSSGSTQLRRASTASGGGRRGSYQAIGQQGDGQTTPRRKSQYVIQGTSTFLQSWFNTLNALVGVGILALPLAFSYAGWIGGPLLFLLAGLVTNYTGKVLAEIMAKQPTLRTYADIGSYAFGPRARIYISLLFCLELWAVCVALIILFADSVSAILPFASVPVSAYKAIGLAIILPTIFLPLNLLSPISVIGIVSTFTLFAVVLADGLVKKEAPGSLWQPGPTSVMPEWSRLPLSFGLIMSGFSSHPVIPSLVKDMKEPHRFPRMLNIAYLAATVIYLSIGAVGYAMFGNHVSDEITRDLAHTKGFPDALNKIALWLIVINPISKFALASSPINTTLEVLFGIEPSQIKMMQRASRRKTGAASQKPSAQRTSGLSTEGNGSLAPPRRDSTDLDSNGSAAEGHQDQTNPLAGSMISVRAAERASGWSPTFQLAARAAVKVVVALLITVTAILLPGFEKVMAFLGAFLAFATCVFGPLLANLKLYHRDLSRSRIALDVVILTLSLIAAALGTAWAFLPDRSS